MRESGHAVIVTPQLPHSYHNGGIGTFAWAFARLLRGAGYDVTVIYTEPLQFPKKRWISHYARLGIEVICAQETPLELPPGYSRLNRLYTLSEHVASLIPPDAEVVYFADWRANAMHYVRSRRFSGRRDQLAVTVLHGCCQWERYGQRRWPALIENLATEFYERYAVENSDVVIAASEHMLAWARRRWALPAGADSSWLHYPFLPEDYGEAPAQYSRYFKRLVFFGRLESRKGFDLFVEALRELAGDVALLPVREIVFLGYDNDHPYGTGARAAALVEQHTGIPATHLDSLDSSEALQYLADGRAETLVVMPSRVDNLPFTVIEASLMAGLNVLSTRVGGIPEILGKSAPADVLTEPFLRPFRNALRQRLARGPARDTGITPYPWEEQNAAWISLHERLVLQARERALALPARHVEPEPKRPLVDVCVPHHNLGVHLGIALESLEKQTFENFSVTVIDDGSTDPQSIEAFERLERRFAPRGWRFIRTPNAGVCAARNAAARAGTAPYIIFVDADNVALPTMVGDFFSSIEASGDDCLTCHMYVFQGDGPPLQGLDEFGRPRPASLLELYVPLGNAKDLGMLIPFGDCNFIIRRTAFEELGGFDESWHKDINSEDWQLLALASLHGYKLDVIPRALFFYRWRHQGRNNTSDRFLNQCRVVEVYEERLREVGLEGLASLIMGFHSQFPGEARAKTIARESLSLSLERVRMRLWEEARADSRASGPAGAESLRLVDIDFTRDLKWTASPPSTSKNLTSVTAHGLTMPAMRMHPWYPELPDEMPVSARLKIPSDLRGRELVLAAALDESGRGLGGGVTLHIETLAGDLLGTVSLGSAEQFWKLVAIKIPADLPGGALKIAVAAVSSTNHCTTYVTVVGTAKAGAEQRAGFSAWLSRGDHEPLDGLEGLNVGIPHGAILGVDGKPMPSRIFDRDGVQLSAIHLHPGQPDPGADWSPKARIECVAETAGTEWLLLWTMPAVPDGLYRLVEVKFSLNGQHLTTRSFGASSGGNWKHLWLSIPEFREPAEMGIEVLPLSVADFTTLFVAFVGYRRDRPSNPYTNGVVEDDNSYENVPLPSRAG